MPKNKQEQKIEILYEIVRTMNQSNNLHKICKVALDKIAELEYVDLSSIYLVDESTGEAVLKEYRNFPDSYIKRASRIPYPKGSTWKVINSGEVDIVANTEKDPTVGPAGRALGIRSKLGIPISYNGKRTNGVLWMLSYKNHQFSEYEVEFLKTIGNQIAIALQRAKIQEELQWKNKYKDIISSISKKVHSSVNLDEVLNKAVNSLQKDIEVIDNALIYLVEGNEAVLKAATDTLPEIYVQKASKIPYPKGITWKTITEGKPYSVPEIAKDKAIGEAGKEIGLKSLLSVPIKSKNKVIGCIHVSSYKKNVISKQLRELLITISEQVQTAIVNANNVEEIKQSKERYETLFEQSPIGVYIYDNHLIIQDCNERLCEILGSNRKEILGLDLNNLKDTTFLEGMKQTLQGKSHFYKESYYRTTLSSKELWLSVNISPLTNSKGNIIGGISVIENVTERKKAEQALRESEKKYHNLTEISPVGIFHTDKDGNAIYLNQKWCEITGLSPEEGYGKGWVKSLHPEDVQSVVWKWKKCVNEGKEFKEEFRYKCVDDRTIWVIGEAKPTSDESGNIDGYIGTVTDITNLKDYESALLKSEERFNMVLQATNDAICDYNVKEDKLWWNENLKNILGYEPEEISDKRSWENLIHPEDKERILNSTDKAIKDGQKYWKAEYRVSRIDGSYCWVLSRANFIYNANRELIRVVGSMVDTTVRRENEEKIKEQARLLDEANDAIIVKDLENKIMYWNESSERMYGWTKDEVIDKKTTDLFHTYIDNYEKTMNKVFKQGSWIGELNHKTKDGKDITVESRWTLIKNTHGDPTKILEVNTDITEKKKLESQLHRVQRLDSVGTLAGGIAHDLNNILQPISMSLQILQSKASDENTKDIIEMLENNTKRASELIKQILLFSRRVESDKSSININSIISEIKTIIKETFPKSIEFKIDSNENIKSIYGDVSKIHQVLMNLCINARDAMPKGGKIIISVDNCTKEDLPKSFKISEELPYYFIVLTVSDTGIGIPKDKINKIFDPFYTTKNLGEGIGLGLSNVYGIIKEHNGFIDVESKVGEGTKFYVYLPAIEEKEGRPYADEELSEFSQGKGQKILVVDDEPAINQITKQTLESYGYEVEVADNGSEAINIYKHNKDIEVALVDLMMPGIDGPQTIKSLKNINPDIKIIAMSGYSKDETFIDIKDEDIYEFLSKPYTSKTLLNVLNGIFD